MYENAFHLVRQELKRQFEKWGQQDHDDPNWYVILGEEFGEVGKAIFESRRGEAHDKDIDDELIQVAAVALQWYEARRRRESLSTKEPIDPFVHITDDPIGEGFGDTDG